MKRGEATTAVTTVTDLVKAVANDVQFIKQTEAETRQLLYRLVMMVYTELAEHDGYGYRYGTNFPKRKAVIGRVPFLTPLTLQGHTYGSFSIGEHHFVTRRNTSPKFLAYLNLYDGTHYWYEISATEYALVRRHQMYDQKPWEISLEDLTALTIAVAESLAVHLKERLAEMLPSVESSKQAVDALTAAKKQMIAILKD